MNEQKDVKSTSYGGEKTIPPQYIHRKINVINGYKL